MSQGKRAKVRAATRHREGVARELAAVQLDADVVCGMCHGFGDADAAGLCGTCEGTGSGRRALAVALLSDPSQGFDVHLAREHAEQLIAEATVRADLHYAAGNVQAAEHQGGRIRLGQRILAALEGQLGDCATCGGAGEYPTMRGPVTSCQPCRGTGHNLRGVLPAVEVSAQVRCKVARARPDPLAAAVRAMQPAAEEFVVLGQALARASQASVDALRRLNK